MSIYNKELRWTTMILPKYLIRIDDKEKFKLNDGKFTYSMVNSAMEPPYEYGFHQLIESGAFRYPKKKTKPRTCGD